MQHWMFAFSVLVLPASTFAKADPLGGAMGGEHSPSGQQTQGQMSGHMSCRPTDRPEPLLTVADFNGDGQVDVGDLEALSLRDPSGAGESSYHPLYDLDADGDIDNDDVLLATHTLGAKVPLLDRQVARAAQATMAYHGPQGLANAMKDGFLPFTQELKGHGIHYARWDRIDNQVSPEVIEGLNFSPDGRLLAVFYVRVVKRLVDEPLPISLLPDPADDHPPAESFAGLTGEDWHTHRFAFFTGVGQSDWRQTRFVQDLAFPDEVIAVAVDPTTDQLLKMYPDSDKVYAAKFWMLHLWLGELNPCGTFANTSPGVSPDAPDEHDRPLAVDETHVH